MLILKQNAANTVPTPPAGKGTIFLDDSDVLSVKTSDGNVENFPTVAASNAQVVFINGTSLSGEAAFTYDFNNNILTVSGNIAAGNVKTDNLLYANGVPWDLSDPGGSNTQIQFNDDESFGGSAAFTFNKSSNLVTVSANLDANNLNATTHITSGNVWANSGTISAQTLKGEGGNISNIAGGNVTGQVGNALVSGTVYTAAQPNITSVGSLTGLTVTGNANVGNLGTAQVLASANVTAPQLISNVSTGTAPLVVTSTTVVANLRAATSNVANTVADSAQPNITSLGTLTAVAVTGNITGGNVYANSGTIGASLLAGTLTTAAQPNITSLGTLSSLAVTGNASAGNLSTGGNLSVSGNAIITGNLTVDGNLVYVNVETFSVEDPIIQLQTGPNGAAPTSNSGKDVGSALNYYDSQAQIAFMGWDVSNAEFGLASQASITNEVVTFSTYGNLRAGVYFGNAAGLTNIPSGNISGQVANALVAGTVYTAAQPNITSLGTLSSLAVSGNASAGNLNTAGKVVASTLESNVATGTAPLTVASTTKVTNLNADLLDGYDTATAATANTVVVRNADGSFSANIVTANLSGNATTAGTVVTAAQPNITSVGTLTGLGVNGNIAAVNITANTGVFTGNGSGLSALDGANVTGQVGNALVAGTVYTNAQPNITSVGTLSSLAVTGNATAGNVYANSGTIGASLLTGTLTTAAQPNITSVGTLSSLSVTGNVSAGNVSGTLLTGTLTTAAQPNITSVGTLTSLTVSGNISAGNITGGALANGNSNVNIPAAAGNVNISVNGTANVAVITGTGVNVAGTLNATGNANVGNIGATNGVFTNVSGNGSALSALTGANVTGEVGFAAVANSVAAANISGQVANALVAGTVYTAAQPNITSVGTLTSLAVTGNASAGNISTGGVLSVTGNANVGNLGTAQVLASANVTAPQFISNIADGTAPLVVTSTTKVANLNADLLDGYSTATAATANTVVIRDANGSFSANIITGTLSGAATTAGTVTTAAQPNITSVGTLTGLGVNGTVTAVNITANTGVFTGNGSGLSAIAGGNVTGQVANALVAGTVYTAAQPNITSVGTLSSLAVTGNANVGNIGATNGVFTNVSGNGSALTSITGANVTGQVGNALVAGTVYTNAQPNITSVGTLSSLAVTGNATAGNVYANSGTIGASLLTGTLTTAAQPNVTSVGTLTSLSVTGNVAAGNLTTTGVLSVTGTGVSSIAGNLDMTSNTIINLATPTNANDAATKQYVDDVAQGLHTHDSCNAATQTTLASISGGTVTYNNGSSGVGATLTTTGSYTTIDGVTLSDGMRILVKNEANAAHNGIYDRTSSTVLTRSSDFDTPAEMAGGDFTFVTAGTLYDNTGWVMTDPVTTVGTTNVNWVQFSGAGTYTAGTGLTLTGSQFSVNASQTQITSVGTLSGLAVNGTVTASAFTANTGVFTGNGSGLSALAGGNVTGQVANALVAGTVYTAAQPNITSVGTLTGLGVNGTITGVNITANTGVFTGNGSGLSAIAGGNVTGQVANALVAGTVYTAAQPNITSVGTLSSLAVTGTTTSGNFATAGNITASFLVSNVATGTAPLTVTSTTRVANLNVAYANVADNINVTTQSSGNAYLIFANALTGNVAETANASFVANTSNGALYATTFIGALSGAATSATTAGTVTTAAQPNITSVGTLTGLGVNGTVTAVAFTANTGVFTGNGSGLSAIAGGNVTGQVANALVAGTVYTAAQGNITSVGTLTSLNSSGNITAPNLIANTGFVISSVNAAVSAAGTVQGNATALTRQLNVTSTVASGAGVALPTAVAGMRVTIINTAANAVLVYPASGGVINSLATNAAFSQAAGAKLDFVATSTTQWYTLNATYG